MKQTPSYTIQILLPTNRQIYRGRWLQKWSGLS